MFEDSTISQLSQFGFKDHGKVKPIQIGPIEVKPVFLAPMSGVTDMPFRTLVKHKYGAGLVISEMIASEAMIRATKRTLKMATHCAEEFPMAVQIAGCEPEVMAQAAKLNEQRGAAIIDINFGCPAKKVAVKSYAGSALMRDEIKAARILEAVVKAVKVPVTLKMRKGWDDLTQNAPNLARIAQECGIQMITVHGRTRCQFYNGQADWDFISQVKQSVKLPVIVNGDIKTYADASTALVKSGADGVMIGRASYGRPWVISHMIQYLEDGTESQIPGFQEQYETLLQHFEAMVEHYGIESGAKIARKHIAWYSRGLPGSAEFRSEINRIKCYQEIKNRIDSFYKPILDIDPSQLFQMEEAHEELSNAGEE